MQLVQVVAAMLLEMVPTAQAVHEVAPSTSLYVPTLQVEQSSAES